jgi:hypothetical protein
MKKLIASVETGQVQLQITAIVPFGINLAKNVFAVHGVDALGQPALVRPEVPRAK